MQFTNRTTRNHCFTTRTSCTSRTGRGIVYTTDYIGSSPSNNIQFTNCTTRKPLFHDPHESNGSCKKENAITRVVSVRVYWTTLAVLHNQNNTKDVKYNYKFSQQFKACFNGKVIFSRYIGFLNFKLWL